MPARTATKRKRQIAPLRKQPPRTTGTRGTVVRVEAVDPVVHGEDWYTPKVLKLKAQRVVARASFGVFCIIEEEQWERQSVTVELSVSEGAEVPRGDRADWHSTNETGVIGSFSPDALDALIDSLIKARDQAKRIGLLTPRPTPSSFREILALDGSVPRGAQSPSARRKRSA